MTHLIDKDATVAEINRLIAELVEKGEGTMFEQGRISAFEDAKLFLDTLEMKEVDLDYIKDELDRVVKIYKPDGDFGWGTLYNVATHFFELGLKAQKGE